MEEEKENQGERRKEGKERRRLGRGKKEGQEGEEHRGQIRESEGEG